MPYASAVRTSRISRAVFASTRVGTQPVLTQVPPVRRLEHGDGGAEFGGAQGSGGAGRTGADHDDVEVIHGSNSGLWPWLS